MRQKYLSNPRFSIIVVKKVTFNSAYEFHISILYFIALQKKKLVLRYKYRISVQMSTFFRRNKSQSLNFSTQSLDISLRKNTLIF